MGAERPWHGGPSVAHAVYVRDREEAATNTSAIDLATDDTQVYDLDRLAERQPGAHPALTVGPYPLEPTVWVEHHCTACGEAYEDGVEVCLLDGQPLEDVIVSRPFLWLG